MNIEIIVSRYNEDLSWTLEYPFHLFKYTVYNKGPNIDFEKSHVSKIITLPNVGRCDHTYLYHVVNNYSNLANVTVFFPGSINQSRKKNNAVQLLLQILSNKNAVFIGNSSQNIKKQFESFTLENWVCTDPKNAKINPESKLLPSEIRPYGKWFQHYFGNIKVTHWCVYGIFSINKYDIVKHKKERYQRLLETVETHSNPEVGHYLERSWVAVFYPLLFTVQLTKSANHANHLRKLHL